MIPDPDDEPTDAERREAEALARALDDGRAHEHLPEDAWQAALLLRSVDPVPPVTIDLLALRRRRLRRGLWAGLALAATIVLAVGLAPRGADLPRPTLELLQAQAAAATGAELEPALRDHRRALLEALADHYRSAP